MDSSDAISLNNLVRYSKIVGGITRKIVMTIVIIILTMMMMMMMMMMVMMMGRLVTTKMEYTRIFIVQIPIL